MSGEEPHYGERDKKEQQRMYDNAKNDCDSRYQQCDKNVGKHGYPPRQPTLRRVTCKIPRCDKIETSFV